MFCCAVIVGFDSARYSVAEGGEVTITVELSAPAIEAVSVDLSTIEGTAGSKLLLILIIHGES